jgi:hypothetical protein
MRSWTILLAAALTAVALPACSSGSGPTGPSSTAAAENPATRPAGAPPAAAGGGSLCDEYRTRRPAIAGLTLKALKGDPADVKAFLDGVLAADQAYAAAAPRELRADIQVTVRVHQHDRDVTEQAGWSPLAMTQATANDLKNEEYMKAFEDFAGYLHDHCGIDVFDTTK